MPTSADLAIALVDALNAAGFPQPFTAVRAYLPLYELGELERLRVTVVVAARTLLPIGRGRLQIDHRLDIAVQQKLAVEDPLACDPLLALVAAIADHLSRRSLPGAAGSTATWVRTEHEPLVDPGHLHELRQVTSIISVTYRTWE